MRAKGCALNIGEFGYTDNGTSTAGSYQLNYDGALANMQVSASKGLGLIAWHGNWGAADHYSLRTSGTFFGTAPLTDFGSRLWALTH